MINAIASKLKSKKGDIAIDSFLSILVYLLTFTTLLLALIYVLQVYNACYICRRVVRDIEIRGQYVASTEMDLANQLGGAALDGLGIEISEVEYWDDATGKIQLQNPFTITLTAHYDIKIASFGAEDPVELELPIEITLKGYSERYWKSTS